MSATPKRTSSRASSKATPKPTPKSTPTAVTGVKSSSQSAGESAPASGKRGRNDAGSAAKGSEGQNKKLKGKLIAPEEQEENVALLKKLSSINGLESSGEGINTANDIGETYLHFAAFHSRPDLVKWLIDKGAECDMQDDKGRTALARCAGGGDDTCVRLLLQANADVDLADKSGISPLHYASLSSSYENVTQLLQYEALVNTFDKTNGSSPLHDACFAGALKCVQALVEAGAQVDMQTKSECGKNGGAVALHYAAQQDQPQVVNYLIRQRASVNKQDARGCTPLHYAAYTGATKAVRMLLQHKADRTKPNKDGETPAKLVEKNEDLDKERREELLALLDPAAKPVSIKKTSCVIC